MPAGDVFGLDGFFLNKSNPVVVSTIGINSTGSSAGIAITGGSFSSGTVTLNLSNAAGLSTTPFYTGAKIAVSGLADAAGVAFTGYNGNFVVSGFAGTTTVSYATTGYVGGVTASITTTGLVMLVTDAAVTNTTWSTVQTHGLFGGGNSFGIPTYSTVERIDFSNDSVTASVRGSLSLARTRGAATGNSNYGWFGGGLAPAGSTVDRIDFSNDSATASPRGTLSIGRVELGATGNSNYGWFCGGQPAATRTIVDRIDFSNDSGTASPRGPLSRVRDDLAATGNSNYGWFGTNGTIDRIDFSNDTAVSSQRSTFTPRSTLAATGNSNYGWWGGGYGPGRRTIVDRIDFSNDLSAALSRGLLNQSRNYLAATGNSNYGWFGGGYGAPDRSTIERINFSNDSVLASVRGPLRSTKRAPSATSGQVRSSSIRLAKTGNYGWFGGGIINGPVPSAMYSRVDRIDFSNDSSTASVRGPLSLLRYGLAATGNSNYGWFGGGLVPSVPAYAPTDRVDRIDFSNDSPAASIRGPLSSSKYLLAATGNSNYGWFGGGNAFFLPTPLYSIVDRINFSNDLTSISQRNPLLQPRFLHTATGNSNYGWFGGGSTPTSYATTVERIDFSNDSTTTLERGSLSLARGYVGATGNSNYGWFGGSNTSPAGSTVDRIDFSNDSATASIRGPLSAGRYGLAATGNSNYGWFGGGAVPSTTDRVDRINFSNDSVSALPRGRLSLARTNLAAVSNTPIG